MLKEEKDSLTAVVEFETPEEADYALSKEAKGFDGHEISIERGQSTTLYVTNYPAHADEAWLRNLYNPFGEIVGIRFPSLKYDAHRRFCYVQFASAEEAIAATQLDGTDVEGLKLVSKISDPNAKKKRQDSGLSRRESNPGRPRIVCLLTSAGGSQIWVQRATTCSGRLTKS